MRFYTSVYLLLCVCMMAVLDSCEGNSGKSEAEFDASQLSKHSYHADSADILLVDVPDSVLTYEVSTAAEAQTFMDESPDSTKYRDGILHQMAKDNLDYTQRLLQNRHNYFVVVDKPSMYVVLYDRFGREQAAYKMACSKNFGTKHKRRDNRTPEGFFSAEGVYNSTEWLYTDDDGNTSPVKGQFGPRFIRLETDVTRQVGIHGTCAPWSLGRRASHGCIRIHNDNIMELVKYVEAGTPIIVNPSQRDVKVNEEEGYHIPTINIGKVKKEQLPEAEKKQDDDTKSEDKPKEDSTDHNVIEALDTIPSTMPF